MNILVCMKAVPSTGQVQVDGQFKLCRESAKLDWNIADQSALETALQLKGTNGTVTLITMGPSKLEDSMRELLARGADRAVLVTDPAFAGSDTYATANTLAATVRTVGSFDLILCGRRTIDGETGQVPSMLACALSIPCVTNVSEITIAQNTIHAVRHLENGIQKLQLPCPALISISEYSCSLRLPGIMGMRKAKEKNIEILRLSDLEADQTKCGLNGSLTKVIRMDSKFPGLRKGPKDENISLGIRQISALLREVGK